MKEQADIDRNGQTRIPSELNDRTVGGYEGCALDYANSTVPDPGDERETLRKLLSVVGRGSRLLEIGSGPGWDADWLEAQGLIVRRTDAAEAFVDLQKSRGKIAEQLNVLSDPLEGPYDAIVALYVLQHIERSALPLVFGKIAQALRAGGTFLFSIREGTGEMVEKGSEGRTYYVAFWRQPDLEALLQPLGFSLLWSTSTQYDKERWLTLMCRK